jgi:hypothetical protein
MMQQVLVAHPSSGKAHFVQAELFSRQGKLAQARESMAMAEKLTPGLSFAKPEAVQALRTQLAASSKPGPATAPQHRSNTTAADNYSSPAAPSSPFPWGLALAMGGGAIGIAIFLLRKKQTPSFEPQPVYASQGAMAGGLSGPQGFGMGNNTMAAPGAAQPGYGPGAGSGLGGRIMGGVATGLAVGAGVMAAEAIGRNLMGHREQAAKASENLSDNNFQPIDNNPDMGGQDFGVNDAGSWDDAGGVDAGGDWDN